MKNLLTYSMFGRGVTLLFTCAKVLTSSSPTKNFLNKSAFFMRLLI